MVLEGENVMSETHYNGVTEPVTLRDKVREHVSHGITHPGALHDTQYGRLITLVLQRDGVAENVAQTVALMSEKEAGILTREVEVAWYIEQRAQAAVNIGELILRALDRLARPDIEQAFEEERELLALARHEAAAVEWPL